MEVSTEGKINPSVHRRRLRTQEERTDGARARYETNARAWVRARGARAGVRARGSGLVPCRSRRQ